MDAEPRVGAPPPRYSVRPDNLGIDGPTFVGVSDGNVGPVGHLAEKFYHFYEDSSYGPPVASILESPGGVSVGVVAIWPRPKRRAGRDVATGVLAHLAVRQDLRSLGPALAMVEEVLARAPALRGFLWRTERKGAVSAQTSRHARGELAQSLCPRVAAVGLSYPPVAAVAGALQTLLQTRWCARVTSSL